MLTYTNTYIYINHIKPQTTIRFKHNGKEYDLDVVETLGPKDEPVDAIRVQVGEVFYIVYVHVCIWGCGMLGPEGRAGGCDSVAGTYNAVRPSIRSIYMPK